MFIIAISVIFGNQLVNTLNDNIQADTTMSAESKAVAQQAATSHSLLFDNLFVFIIVLFWLMLILSAIFIDTHPAFFIVTVLLLVVVFLISAYLANSYEDLVNDSELSSYAEDFPKMNYIMSHLVGFAIMIGGTSALALFAKKA